MHWLLQFWCNRIQQVCKESNSSNTREGLVGCASHNGRSKPIKDAWQTTKWAFHKRELPHLPIISTTSFTNPLTSIASTSDHLSCLASVASLSCSFLLCVPISPGLPRKPLHSPFHQHSWLLLIVVIGCWCQHSCTRMLFLQAFCFVVAWSIELNQQLSPFSLGGSWGDRPTIVCSPLVDLCWLVLWRSMLWGQFQLSCHPYLLQQSLSERITFSPAFDTKALNWPHCQCTQH